MISSGGVEAWEGDTVSAVWCFFVLLFDFFSLSFLKDKHVH